MSLEETHIKNAADTAERILVGKTRLTPLSGQVIAIVRDATLEAPLRALAMAFVLGVLVARRK